MPGEWMGTRKCVSCGKKFEVLYPGLWAYKRGTEQKGYRYFCTWKCLRAYEKKGAKDMARPRKDGTPAKKPEVKVVRTIPEAMEKIQEKFGEMGVDLVYDESIADEYRAEQEAKKAAADQTQMDQEEQEGPLAVAGLFSRIIRYGRYSKQTDMITHEPVMMRCTANDVDLVMKRKEWIRLTHEIRRALDKLDVRDPQPAEIEGGGSSFWYVCPECRGNIGREDRYCKHCGQPIGE